MGIEANAIDKVLSLAVPNMREENGLLYTDKPLTLVTPPTFAKFDVQTLDGMVDLLTAGIESFEAVHYVAQVTDHTNVRIIGRQADAWGRRYILVEAKALVGLTAFTFNQFQGQESFLIGLNSLFEKSDDRDYLLSIASQIDLKESVKLGDDGISQSITVSKGIAMKDTVALKNRVTLAPFRTFREISQPQSDFIFRAKDGGNLALYEADGGAWKIAAINAIAAWLKNAFAGAGLGDLPVIS